MYDGLFVYGFVRESNASLDEIGYLINPFPRFRTISHYQVEIQPPVTIYVQRRISISILLYIYMYFDDLFHPLQYC
jgi:hypothetical protein